MATIFNPAPYRVGQQLDLQVCESYSHDLSPQAQVTATISKVLSITMAVVLDVSLPTQHGPPIHRVLKLYDRRFGSCLRDTPKGGPVPYTQENEAAFQAFVERGRMPKFLRYLKKRNETELFAVAAWRFLNEPDSDELDRTKALAKYEATLWYDCVKYFECETKAYNRLADFQGKLVPHMLASVSLSPPTKLATIPREGASYFDVRGILLERIDGYCLEDLTLSPLPRNLRTWHQIIQLAADAAHEINKRGIIMWDCAPRNVVMDKQSNAPRIIDLAQCRFQDELVEVWYKRGWHEDEGWDPDVEYWEQVCAASNPAAIGVVMAMRIQKLTGVEMDFNYPDYDAIIAEIERRKAEADIVEGERAPQKLT